MVVTFLAIGVFGFLGLSVLCPLLAWPAYLFRAQKQQDSARPSGSSPMKSIDILLPAHNEAEWIEETLTSIQRSITYLDRHLAAGERPVIRVQVGADNCKDSTADIARQFPGVSVREFKSQGSKWSTLLSLIE